MHFSLVVVVVVVVLSRTRDIALINLRNVGCYEPIAERGEYVPYCPEGSFADVIKARLKRNLNRARRVGENRIARIDSASSLQNAGRE